MAGAMHGSHLAMHCAAREMFQADSCISARKLFAVLHIAPRLSHGPHSFGRSRVANRHKAILLASEQPRANECLAVRFTLNSCSDFQIRGRSDRPGEHDPGPAPRSRNITMSRAPSTRISIFRFANGPYRARYPRSCLPGRRPFYACRLRSVSPACRRRSPPLPFRHGAGSWSRRLHSPR